MTDQTARTPYCTKIRYGITGAPTLDESEMDGSHAPGVGVLPTSIELVYSAARDGKPASVSASVAGDWMRFGKPDGGQVTTHFSGGPDGWPFWLAEEARLHDPDAAVPSAVPPPAADRLGECVCGRTPDPGICPYEHDGYKAGGHCTCAHPPVGRDESHRLAERQIRGAARGLFFDVGARVLAVLDDDARSLAIEARRGDSGAVEFRDPKFKENAENLNVAAETPACPDPIECGHEAALGQARETNRRLNLRAQKLESELGTYRRAVGQWEDRLRAALNLPAVVPGGAGEEPADETREAEAHPPTHAWKVESPRRDQWASWGATHDERVWAAASYDDVIEVAPQCPFRLVRATTTYAVEAEHQPAAGPAGGAQQPKEADRG